MSPDRKREPFVGDPLPRGRHKLTPHEVRSSQRERLLQAMLDQVGEQGYAATTVPEVVTAARVSRSAFYELFEDKADCFLALCDEQANELLGALMVLADESDWARAVQRGMRVYLDWWKERPAFSRAYFVELPSAGARAAEQRERQQRRFVAMFEALAARAREARRELEPASHVALRVFVGGVTDVVAEEVRAGRLARLPRLEHELVRLTLRLLADDATAEAAEAELRRVAA